MSLKYFAVKPLRSVLADKKQPALYTRHNQHRKTIYRTLRLITPSPLKTRDSYWDCCFSPLILDNFPGFQRNKYGGKYSLSTIMNLEMNLGLNLSFPTQATVFQRF